MHKLWCGDPVGVGGPVGGQGGCERRIEVIVKMKEKKNSQGCLGPVGKGFGRGGGGARGCWWGEGVGW